MTNLKICYIFKFCCKFLTKFFTCDLHQEGSQEESPKNSKDPNEPDFLHFLSPIYPGKWGHHMFTTFPPKNIHVTSDMWHVT